MGPRESFARGQRQIGYVSVGIGVPEFSLDLSRKQTDSDLTEASVSFAPNLPLTGLVGGSFYGFSLAAALDIDGTSESVEPTSLGEKVKTDYASYGVSYYFDRLGFSSTYTSLQGMNIVSVTGASTATIDTEASSHRSDIKLEDQSANLWITPLSYNLSLRDFFDLASPSRGSGIGFVTILSFDALSIRGRQALIPSSYSAPYGRDGTFEGGDFQSVGGQIGPAFVLDVMGVYLQGMMTFGSGYQQTVYHNEGDLDQTTDRHSDKQDLYLAAGYKGKRVFTAIDYNMESPGFSLGSINISTIRSTMKWVLGVRF